MKSTLLLVLASLLHSHAALLGPEFTYQGRLTDAGAPANGEHDLRFILYNASVGGGQSGPILTNQNITVTNGVFTSVLNFGTNAFTGQALWLEVAVRPGASEGAFTSLDPRQPLTATPYAFNALSFSGPLPGGQLLGHYGSPNCGAERAARATCRRAGCNGRKRPFAPHPPLTSNYMQQARLSFTPRRTISTETFS